MDGERASGNKRLNMLLAISLAAIIGGCGFGIFRQFFTVREQKKEIALLEAETEAQQAVNDGLLQAIIGAQTQENVERIARERLNMSYDGEVHYNAGEN